MLAASRGPDEDDELAILVRHEPGYVLVTVAGEVDFASAAGLRERLVALAAAGRPLVADLDRVSFIDAAGLGALAGAARHATAHGSSLRVVCGRRQVRRLFGLTQLDQVVPLAGSLAEILLQAAEAGAEAV
jgi:anti-sigma B factor antagonist